MIKHIPLIIIINNTIVLITIQTITNSRIKSPYIIISIFFFVKMKRVYIFFYNNIAIIIITFFIISINKKR